MPHIVLLDRGGRRHECPYVSGETLLSAAKKQAVDIEGACGGVMACATCQVIIRDGSIDHLPKAQADERSLLDAVPCSSAASRLSCQIVLNEYLDGLIVEVV